MAEVSDNSLLFVYGALTDDAERRRLLGRSVESRPAWLPGYARGRSRHYFVLKNDGAETAGQILLGLTPHDLAILDDYEDVPRLYTRERVDVRDASNARVSCWIYLPTDWAKGE